MWDEPNFKTGDLVRSTDDAHANTVYRVIGITEVKKLTSSWWEITVQGVFGLFKQKYKPVKRYKTYNYVKVSLLELATARAQFDMFIQQETKRLSGE